MTAPTTTREQFTQAGRAGQDVVASALRGWGESMRAVVMLPTGRADAPRPDRLLDAWFDVAGEALTAQREFSRALLKIGDPAVDALNYVARRTVEATIRYSRAATAEPGRDSGGAT